MFVVGFWNNYKTVILNRSGKIISYDRLSLETCIGRGERIELEYGDVIQNSFDEKFKPREYNTPNWLEKKFLNKKWS